jgi:methylated-DNA-[protein]-cysteine S-methyltransferase
MPARAAITRSGLAAEQRRRAPQAVAVKSDQPSTAIQPQRPSQPPNDRAPTPFELRLHEACKRVPAGKVTTYGSLAKVLNSSPRAVGQALRRNPYAPAVPCHRVVAASLELGGFSGSWGAATPNVQRKKAMLEGEGVKFDGQRVADADAVMGPGDF